MLEHKKLLFWTVFLRGVGEEGRMGELGCCMFFVGSILLVLKRSLPKGNTCFSNESSS